MAAVATIQILPAVAITFLAQKYIVSGLLTGSVHCRAAEPVCPSARLPVCPSALPPFRPSALPPARPVVGGVWGEPSPQVPPEVR